MSDQDNSRHAARVALVTGVTGQDGQYLSEQLLADGYRVIGTVRNSSRGRQSLPPNLRERVDLVELDMLDQSQMAELLFAFKPTEVYNLAACTSGAGMFDAPLEIAEVNGLAVVRMLEAIRAVDPDIRFCQASSSEIFGDATEQPQSEETPARPRSPYGAAKYYSQSMTRLYRARYGLFSCSAILFNHESPRRGAGYVTRKVTRAAAAIKLGMASEVWLGNLDARRDWGYAGEYMEAMRLMLAQVQADDYVIATGTTHSVRELCEYAFGHVGLDYREHVRVDESVYRAAEPFQLAGNPAKAHLSLGWKSRLGFGDLVRMMVDNDLQAMTTLE